MEAKILFLIFDIILMLLTVDAGSIDSDNEYNSPTHTFSWQNMGPGHRLPDNAVLGGQNTDTTPLFVAKGTGQYQHLYGKLAIRYGKNNAFFGENNREIGTSEFQVLTAKSYVWCYPRQVSENSQVIKPVCRSTHLGYLCIGQLEGNQCGLPWGRGVVYYSNYEVVVIGTEC